MPISIAGSGTVSGVSPGGLSASQLVLGTAQNSTSGTSIDFTGIPSWVKRITVMLNGVSTNGANNILLRVGSGSVATTGYSGWASFHNFNNPTSSSRIFFSTEFTIYHALAASSSTGVLQLLLQSGNTWMISGQVGDNDYPFSYFGSITLSGALDRVRIAASGADTFDAGSINILYE